MFSAHCADGASDCGAGLRMLPVTGIATERSERFSAVIFGSDPAKRIYLAAMVIGNFSGRSSEASPTRNS
jgi:hypothetical protein